MIILLSFLDRWINGRRIIYIASLIFTGIFAVIDGLVAAKIPLGGLNKILEATVPLYKLGIGWAIPAVLGAIIGLLISLFTSPPKQPA
ncbi:branched-chain amino acid transporter [Bacillus safensis FO-36b] [Bacillus safensis subsp. safensis]